MQAEGGGHDHQSLDAGSTSRSVLTGLTRAGSFFALALKALPPADAALEGAEVWPALCVVAVQAAKGKCNIRSVMIKSPPHL